MPALSKALPKYRKHRASGQAVVNLSGKDFYLGPHGTKTSKLEYDRVVAEWLQRGRILEADDDEEGLTVVEVLAAYKRHAETYYRKNGKPTREVGCIAEAAQFVKDLYGRQPAVEFGPLSLQVVQQQMVKGGLSRRFINKQTGRIKRAFKWAVAQELIPPSVHQALQAVTGLRKGRTDAQEPAPVLPVADSVVEATLPHLPQVVADMVRFHRLTGCRPEDVCHLRPCDVDTSEEVWLDVWLYTPASHKMEHKQRARVIFIGPKAQAVLGPYLDRDREAFCFSPQDSERKRRREQHEQRQTPLSCGNRPGTNRKAAPGRPPGIGYTTTSYGRAIRRACEEAFPPPDDLEGEALKAWKAAHYWAPNRLRHSAGTEVRKRFGVEAAQVILGHAKADVTQVYAERDLQKAADVMRIVG